MYEGNIQNLFWGELSGTGTTNVGLEVAKIGWLANVAILVTDLARTWFMCTDSGTGVPCPASAPAVRPPLKPYATSFLLSPGRTKKMEVALPGPMLQSRPLGH